ncbi:hypothetical protein LBMAG49_20810 [Planctomycetota bacterium]|nr:hypothetical protein LBMAG49_20810 [Planctomycetota bacterium]
MRILPFLMLLVGASQVAAQNPCLQLVSGIDGGVDLAFNALFVPPTGITVETWITYDDASIATGLWRWPTIIRQNTNPGAEVWFLRVNAANTASRVLIFAMKTPSGVNNSVSYPFTSGEFAQLTHIAATYDGQNLTLYKNGLPVASRALSTAQEIPNNGGAIRIGNGDPSVAGIETWNGRIDELRVWPMARTQAEIQASMNEALSGVPGGVLTFNFDGHYIDTSNLLFGTPFGSVNFGVGPNLTQASPNAINVGVSTTTCSRAIQSLAGSLPKVGNTAFSLWAIRGPTPARSPLALVAIGGQPAPSSQLPFAGVQLAFDITTFLTEVALLPASGVLGNTRFALPLPNALRLIGTSYVFQIGYVDALCGPQGIAASDGLYFTIQ